MKTRKIVGTASALSLALVIFTGCTSSSSPLSSSSSSGTSSELAPYTLTILVAGTEPKDQAKVNAQVEAETKSTLNIKMNVQYTDWADYQQQVKTEASAGTQFDIYLNFSNDVIPAYTRGQAIKLNDLLDKYGKDIKANIPAATLAQGYLNKDLIAIPAVYLTDDTYSYALVRQDLREKYGSAPITDLNTLNAFLTAVHKNDPTISPIETNVGAYVQRFINLQNPQLKTVVYGASQAPMLSWTESGPNAYKVQDYVETKNFTDMVAWGAQAMNSGWEAKDLNTGTTPGQLFDAGKAALMNIDPYNFTSNITATTAAVPGAKIEWSILSPDQPLQPGLSNNFAQISSTSKDPTRAMMFLNWLQASRANYDLWYWGIEGTDYTLDSNGVVQLPKGVAGGGTAGVNNPYAPNLWYFKNSKWDRFVNTDAPQTVEAEKSNMSAKRLPTLKTMNFTFDPKNVQLQMDQMDKIYKQYYSALANGQLQGTSEYNKFISDLKAAGLQAVIDECQKQLDAYMAANNISATS